MESKLVSGKLLTKNGLVDSSSLLDKVPVICYYFSAHWCPPCRKFTPVLADLYNKWNSTEKKIEVVFISCDKTEEQFKEYFGSMPWVAVPFGDIRIKNICQKFQLHGIPKLVVVSRDEKTLEDDAVQEVLSKKEKVIDEWIKLK